MDAILDKLSEIEEAATRILDRTAERKKYLADEMRARTEAFDQEMEREHTQKMEQERESLQKQREEKLQQIWDGMNEQMNHLESAFEQKHSDLSDEIVRRILEG